MPKHEHGILDTSVIIDIRKIGEDRLPSTLSITALTLAELTAGPLAAGDPAERALRMERLQWAESHFEAIPFDGAAARAYSRIYAAAFAMNQKPRGSRAMDFLIAAIALSRSLPLYTRNAADFASAGAIVEIVAI